MERIKDTSGGEKDLDDFIVQKVLDVSDGESTDYELEKFRTMFKYLIKKIEKIREVVSEQAEDEGLWFEAQSAPEAYLRHELRRLHEIIEEV